MAVQALVRAASEPTRGLVAGLISGVVLLVGATTVFAELQSALDRIWHVPQRAKPSGLWAVLRARVLSFGLILGLAFLLIVSLVISAGWRPWAAGPAACGQPGRVTLQALNTLIAVGATTVLFAMIFKFMPSVPLQWHDVWSGRCRDGCAVRAGQIRHRLLPGQERRERNLCSSRFAGGGAGLGVLRRADLSAGAEFTKVYADERGSAVGKRAVAATQTGALVAAAGSDITADMLPAAPAGAASPAAHSDVLQAQVQMLEQRTGQQRAQLWALAGLVLAQQVRWHWHRRKTRRAPRP